jgi:hypothetical protein
MALTLSSIVIAAQVVSLAVKPIAYNGATGERREPGRNAPDATSVLDCIPAKPAERELPGRPRHRPGTIQRARPRRMAGPWDALTVEPAGAVQVARHGRRGRSRRKRRCHDGVRGGVVLGVGPSEHDLLAVAGGPQRIPALLQTPAYARALAEIDPGLAERPERHWPGRKRSSANAGRSFEWSSERRRCARKLAVRR